MIDFTDKTYAAILAAMLGRVPNDVDKREGSLIQTALGPAGYALEEAYLDLLRTQQGAHLQTAVGGDLDLCAADVGLSRYPASEAVRLGVFSIDVPIGGRFSTNEAEPVFFTVLERVSSGQFRLICETAGERGNLYVGPLVAVTHVPGLAAAQITDILIPGADREEDEAFRARCIAHLNSKPFGGNVAAYRETVTAMDGVGGVQVYPTWNGGGTVKCSVIGADYMPASATLVEAVQTALDPEVNQGVGLGLAPIGACVTVTTPTALSVNVSAAVLPKPGYTLEQVRPGIEKAMWAYLESLRREWSAPTVPGGVEYALSVYAARLTAAALGAEGVANVTGLTLNGGTADLVLTESGLVQQLPVLGEVTLHGN